MSPRTERIPFGASISVMRYGHELGQHRSAEDDVVRGAELCNFKCYVLRAEVLLCSKGDRQANMTYGVRSLAGHDPIEGLIACSHLVEVEVHLLAPP
jgi:hypothetical protein